MKSKKIERQLGSTIFIEFGDELLNRIYASKEIFEEENNMKIDRDSYIRHLLVLVLNKLDEEAVSQRSA